MKMISWNVNGLRACLTKGFMDFFNEADADIFCLQETKLQEGQHDLDLPGYYQYWNYAEKKGYSGTALFTKKEPLSVTYGIGIEEHDHEGRVITAEFEDFYFITVYVPNSKHRISNFNPTQNNRSLTNPTILTNFNRARVIVTIIEFTVLNISFVISRKK